MKKSKFLAILLVLVMAISVVAMVACQPDEKPDDKDNTKKTELLVWAPSDAQSFYKKHAEEWAKTYKDSTGKEYSIKMGIMGEGDAGTTVLNAPQDAADVFCFADDQLAKLVDAGTLAAIGNPNDENAKLAKEVAERNVESSVIAATGKDGKLYAYPMQADNGYFLYYNSKVISEEQAKSLESIFAAITTYNTGKEKADQVKFQMDYGTAWYQAALFFTFGGEVNETSTNFDTEAVGVNALQLAYNISSFEYFSALSPDQLKAGLIDNSIAAGICGGWIYGGSDGVSQNKDIKLTILPKVKGNDNKDYQMKAFLGSKLLGVNAQGKNLEASHALANYLTSEAVQLDKVKVLQAGPSNKKVGESAEAKALPTLQAISAQSLYSVPQINLPAGFWDALPTCVNAVNKEGIDVADYVDANGKVTYTEKVQALLAALKTGFKLATPAA